MHLFRRVQGRLHAESVDLMDIVRKCGTPTYVYSAGSLESNYRRLAAALAPVSPLICYAVKANSHLAVLRLFSQLGAGLDLVSGGELRRALAAGAKIDRCVFAGVGKSEQEIGLGLVAGVKAFHVESESELERINRIAGRIGRRAPVALRVNPDVDAGTHAKITTGKSENKFGIPLAAAAAAYEAAARLPHVEIVGIQMHIGSQITSPEPFTAAVDRLGEFVAAEGGRFPFRYVSIGGGIGIAYHDALASGEAAWWEDPAAGRHLLTPESFAAALLPRLQSFGRQILLEPGRFLVGNAGVLLTQVEYIKRGAGRTFVIVDAGMNDLVRPAMYDAYHEIVPVVARPDAVADPVDIVGPVCESSDRFAQERLLPLPAEGEAVALMSAGAYGASMASRYNTRGLPAEVMVRDGKFEVITERESFEDLVRKERIPASLRPPEPG